MWIYTIYVTSAPNRGQLKIALNFCSDLFVLSWNLTA